MNNIKINVCGNDGIVSNGVYYFGKGLYKIGELSIYTAGSFANVVKTVSINSYVLVSKPCSSA